MDYSEFVTLVPNSGRRSSRMVSISKNGSYIARPLLLGIGNPERVDIQVNARTGQVRIIPGDTTSVASTGQIGSILSTFCRNNGWVLGSYPARVTDGAIAFGLNREVRSGNTR